MGETKRLNLAKQFPPVSTEKWEAVINKDLKGGDYAKKLLWQTEEGITIKPYYRSADLTALDGVLDTAPGQFPFVRGTTAKPGWRIREEIDERDPAKANELARKALESGADEICFVIESGIDGVSGVRATTPQDLSVLLSRIPLDAVSVHFRAGSQAKLVYEALVEGLGPRALHLLGSIDFDSLGDLAYTGASAIEKRALFDTAAELVASARKRTPLMKVLAVRGWQYQESGGTSVQELGVALAQAIEYVSELTSRGLTAEQVANAMFFSFSVSSNYFFEIAKLRAARMLWAQVLAGFGVADELSKTMIHTRTSHWNTTIYDPYVNVLRGTTEAMSAAVAGADSVAVTPFDEPFRTSDEFSRRLARNTQIILKKEAYLDNVVDPAGGSYYVETLTHSMAREAWKLMQQIEGCGSFMKCLEDGWIQKGIEKSRQAKEAAIIARRKNLLGTNQYPNAKERVIENLKRLSPVPQPVSGPAAIRVDALRPYRGAEVFEALRLRMERHASAGGKTPRVLLVEIGDLKMRRARSSFCANFFGCGGFDIVEAVAEDTDSAYELTVANDADIVVLCSSDVEYVTVAGPIIRKLRDHGKATAIVVAGYPTEMIDKLHQDGVAGFVHIKSNPVEVLKGWQDSLGVRD